MENQNKAYQTTLILTNLESEWGLTEIGKFFKQDRRNQDNTTKIPIPIYLVSSSWPRKHQNGQKQKGTSRETHRLYNGANEQLSYQEGTPAKHRSKQSPRNQFQEKD
jgi:hypothetical protein